MGGQLDNMEAVFAYSVIKTATIWDEKVVDGQIKIILDEDYDPEYNSFLAIPVRIIGSTQGIKKLSKCVILFANENDRNNAYFLGVIQMGMESGSKDAPDNDDRNVVGESPKGRSKIIADDEEVSFQTLTSEMSLGDGTFNVDIGSAAINMKPGFVAFSSIVGDDLRGSIVIDQSEFNFYHERKVFFESTDAHFKQRGNFIISGPIDTEMDYDNPIDQYLAMDRFYVKAREINLESQGGMLTYNGNIFKADLGSSKLGGGFVPGTGPWTAWEVTVLDGDVDWTIGLGNYNITVDNLTFINGIDLRVGTPLHPTAGGLTIGAFSNKMYLETAYFPIGSYLEFSTGGFTDLISFADIKIQSEVGNILIDALLDISLDAVKNINISSFMDTSIDAMNVNISSMMNTSIDATAKMTLSSLAGTDITTNAGMNIESMIDMKIKSMLIDLKAEMNMNLEAQFVNVKSQILDLTQAQMIQAGPKSVVPTGSGPFCGAKFCYFTGAPVAGEVAV